MWDESHWSCRTPHRKCEVIDPRVESCIHPVTPRDRWYDQPKLRRLGAMAANHEEYVRPDWI